jgi:hypothetical protein
MLIRSACTPVCGAWWNVGPPDHVIVCQTTCGSTVPELQCCYPCTAIRALQPWCPAGIIEAACWIERDLRMPAHGNLFKHFHSNPSYPQLVTRMLLEHGYARHL